MPWWHDENGSLVTLPQRAGIHHPGGIDLDVEAIGRLELVHRDLVCCDTDSNGKREARPVLTGLNRPNGIAFHNGTLYVAELSQVSKIEDIESKLDQTLKPTVIYSDLPKDEPHGWKFLTVGPDNRLYFQVGALPATSACLRMLTPRSAASIWMAAT